MLTVAMIRMGAKRSATHSLCSWHLHVPRRGSHRAPDYAWLNDARNHAIIDYNYLPSHPVLFKQYLQVAAVAKEQGLAVFVHAEPKRLRAVRLFVEEATKQNCTQFFHALRLIPKMVFFRNLMSLNKRLEAT